MTAEENQSCQLAIGRILRIASRPAKEGDIAEYERCRSIIMDICGSQQDYAPNWVRDRLKGASGD